MFSLIKSLSIKLMLLFPQGTLVRRPAKAFYHVYCDFCEREVLPEVLNRYKGFLGEDATFLDLVNKWDAIPNEKNQTRQK